MKALFLALAPMLLFSLPVDAADLRPAQPGPRCDLVKKSSILDLDAFCRGKALDKRRLVDYGNQLEVLDSCGEKVLGKSIATALEARVNRDDKTTCAEIAAGLAEDLRGER